MLWKSANASDSLTLVTLATMLLRVIKSMAAPIFRTWANQWQMPLKASQSMTVLPTGQQLTSKCLTTVTMLLKINGSTVALLQWPLLASVVANMNRLLLWPLIGLLNTVPYIWFLLTKHFRAKRGNWPPTARRQNDPRYLYIWLYPRS